MDENRPKSVERPQNKNLKREAGPGRPPGQRNYATIYREALRRIADANDKTPEEIETMLEEVGLKQGLKGNFAFWRDIRDRIHGKPKENIKVEGDITVTQDSSVIAELTAKLNALHGGASSPSDGQTSSAVDTQAQN